MLVYEVRVRGRYVNGTVIHTSITNVLDEIRTHLEEGGTPPPALSVLPKEMTQAELDALPEFGGW